MDVLELQARAKINLSLDVISRRSDGYHEVSMIMQTVGLHDRVTLEKAGGGIRINCSSRWIPTDRGNTAFKAAELLMNKYGVNSGIKITIDKRIPVAAGLAGGSSDAAAVLKGLDRLFGLRLEEAELMSLGKQVGADVPYCITGGTMLAGGIGEELTPLPQLKGVNVVIIKPPLGVSTAWVYKNLELGKIADRPDTQMLADAIKDNRIDILAKNMKNVLETVTEKKYGIITDAKRLLVENGALGSMMSGSGPSVFGIFPDADSAAAAYDRLKSMRWECYLTQTI